MTEKINLNSVFYDNGLFFQLSTKISCMNYAVFQFCKCLYETQGL